MLLVAGVRMPRRDVRFLMCLAMCDCLCHVLPSPEIEEREDEYPDEIDEVPVEAHDLDALITSPAACEEAARAAVEVAAPDFSRDDDEEDHADRDVGAVEP